MNLGGNSMGFAKECRLAKASIAAVASLSFPALAIAGDPPAWMRLGPEGGVIFSIEATIQSPQRLVARGGRQLYKSFDGGKTWQPMPQSRALGALSGHQTVVLPSNEIDTIYALSADARLMRSEDFGANWSQVFAPNDGLPTGVRVELGALSVDPDDNDRVSLQVRTFVASQTYPFTSFTWSTVDRGVNWTIDNFHDCRGYRETVAEEFAATTPRTRITWIAGSTDCLFPVRSPGLYVERGEDFGFYVPLSPAAIVDLQVVGKYAFANAAEGVYRLDLLSGDVRNISGAARAFAARSATEIYIATNSAVRRTQDAGVTWTTLPFTAPGFGTLAHPRVLRTVSTEDVVLAAARGVVESGNAGNTWKASTGITEMKMRALDIDATTGTLWALHTDPMPLFFTTGPGSFRSVDGGQAWTQSNLHTISHVLRDIEVDPTTLSRPGGARVYAAGAGCRDTFGCSPMTSGIPSNGGLYVSDDGGTTFVASNAGLPLNGGTPFVHIVRDITLDPNSASGGLLRRGLFSASRNGWMPGRTNDAGASWQTATGGFDQFSSVIVPYPSQSAFDLNRPGRAYTVAFHGLFDQPGNVTSGVLRSDDSGATWAHSAAGLPTETRIKGVTQSAYGITTDASTADRLWVTTRSEEGVTGLYRSDDGAENWYACGRIEGARFLDKIAQDPDRASRIVVSDRGDETSPNIFHDGAVWVSDNRCLTWQRLGPRLDAGAFGLEIAGHKVYAGTDFGVMVIEMPDEVDGVIFLSDFEQR